MLMAHGGIRVNANEISDGSDSRECCAHGARVHVVVLTSFSFSRVWGDRLVGVVVARVRSSTLSTNHAVQT